jgi:predicted CXXCH cytochrome family protein
MKRVLVAALSLLSAGALAQVAATKHNLSVSGPGALKAVSETQICIFCHTPHNSSPQAPLWNRADPGQSNSYIPYSSATALGFAGQPNGASLLCLSCHDGTIALGNVLSRDTPIAMAGGQDFIPSDASSYLGTDLSDDHPISFAYSDDLATAHGNELAKPATLTGRVRLDASGQLQCTSCHDAHSNTYGMFLVMSNQAGALCTTCHKKSSWPQTSHALSSATWNGAGVNPWPHTSGANVSANGCDNCHRPHTAGGKWWLMNYVAEEDNCYSCHNGNVAQKNVQADFQKTSRHPVELYTGIHQPKPPLAVPIPLEPAVVTQRHVECADCHNPHANTGAAGTAMNGVPGTVPGSLLGVRGVDKNGLEVAQVAYEYQVCFRCHGDSTGQPAPHTARQIPQTNLRLQFAAGNPSYHPVVATGVNTNVPSLLAPWAITSVLKCSDCHNSDNSPAAGGSGPSGPHGSSNPSLLELPYSTLDRTSESPTAYALCYKCHDRTRFTTAQAGASPFEGTQGHLLHVVTERTPCNVCHDPHGISSSQGGTATNNSKLINFDISVVRPNSAGQLRFVSTGLNHGQCYLLCHGQDHNPQGY